MRYLAFLCLLSLPLTAAAVEASDSLKSINFLKKAYENLELQPDSALFYADEVLKIQGVSKSSVNHINALTLKGIIYKNKGFYDLASKAYVEALNKAINSNDFGRVSVCLNNIGVIYKAQENYSQALIYFEKSLEIEKSLDNDLQLSIRHYNIGEVYLELDSLSLAELYFTNSLIIEERNSNNEGVIYGNYGLGQVDLKRKDYESANQKFWKAINSLDTTGESEIGFNLSNSMGEMHLYQGELDSAIFYFEAINESDKKTEFKDVWMSSAKNLADVFAVKNNFEQAYNYCAIHDSLNASITKSISNQKIEELGYMFDLEQKQRQIDLLRFQQNQSAVKGKLNRDIIIFIISSILIVVLAIFFKIRQAKQ
jgi:tetratricopeptide (TPR) repeat protein